MRLGSSVRALALIASVSVVGSCTLVDDPGRMTCGTWLLIPAEQRLTLTDRLVGTSDDVLERIRAAAHQQPLGLETRAGVIRWVAASVTKNCDIWPPRTRTVRGTFDALYP